jgi:hypothetical protein
MGNGSTQLSQKQAQAMGTNHQSIQDLPLHICILLLNKCQLWVQTGQDGSQNRSDRFHQTIQAGYQNRSDRFDTADHTPQKSKMQKKCRSIPLTLGIGSRDAMQLFSAFLFPLCCQCMNQGSNLKTWNLELLKYTKFITRCYTCPNEQVRYSTDS